MKKIEWINGNKMKIATGHRTFDRQTNIISTGNIIANTETGFYLRPSQETECNGQSFSPGHLQNYDLQSFSHLPDHIRKEVKALTDQYHGAILYKFFHYYKPREYYQYSRRVYREYGETQYIHGYILTTTEHHILRIYPTDYTMKTWGILEECARYVSDFGEDKTS